MDGLELLDELEEIIDKGASVPFSGRCILERDELMDVLQELKLKLPDDLKQAKWIKEERQRILQEAQSEADEIIKAANEKGISMINEHEIMQRAYEQANEIIESAQKSARDIRLGARQYVENILSSLESRLTSQIEEIQAGREELRK